MGMPLAHLLGLALLAPQPVKVEIIAGHIYLPVTVNGHKARFVLDTGAQSSVILPQASKELEVTGGVTIQASGAGNETVPARITKVAKIEAGGEEVQNMQAVVLDLPPGLECDGVLGQPFLSKFVTTIDYQQKEVTFCRPKDYEPAKGATELPVKLSTGIPQLEVTISGIKGWATIDTGAAGTLTLTSPFVEQNKLAAKYPVRAKTIVGKGVGGYVFGELFRLPDFEFGPFKMPPLVASMSSQKSGAFASTTVIANIGSDVLSRFKVTFDYPGQRMFLEKAARFSDPSEANRTGIIVDFDGQAEMVVDVVPGSPGAEAGLVKGDEIVELNGKPMSEQKPSVLREAVRQKAGTSLRLKVKRSSGDLVDVTVKLRDWI